MVTTAKSIKRGIRNDGKKETDLILRKGKNISSDSG